MNAHRLEWLLTRLATSKGRSYRNRRGAPKTRAFPLPTHRADRGTDMDTKGQSEISERAPAGQNDARLPWTAPALGHYDTSRMTLGVSNNSTDGFVNTHS